jgi:hypothetical protein
MRYNGRTVSEKITIDTDWHFEDDHLPSVLGARWFSWLMVAATVEAEVSTSAASVLVAAAPSVVPEFIAGMLEPSASESRADRSSGEDDDEAEVPESV